MKLEPHQVQGTRVTDRCRNLSIESHSWIPSVKVRMSPWKALAPWWLCVSSHGLFFYPPLLTHHAFSLHSRCEKCLRVLSKWGLSATCTSHSCLPPSFHPPSPSFNKCVPPQVCARYWAGGWEFSTEPTRPFPGLVDLADWSTSLYFPSHLLDQWL